MAYGFYNSTIGRKYSMAFSALFLMLFLFQHFLINFLSVLNQASFDAVSHFMGLNPLVQYALQPVLIFAVVYHFGMGIWLEIKNRNARPIKYVKFNGNANSSWMSRNMILTGAVIAAFLVLHFIDFWIPEIDYKFISGTAPDPTRYFSEMSEKFHNPLRVVAYVVAFVLLALHLYHGFSSAFQSLGANHKKYNKAVINFGKFYAVLIPLGFVFIALYHYFLHQA